MSYPSPLPNSGIRSSAFGAFASAALGFGLLETACVLLAAQPAVHFGAILAGSALVAVTMRRFLHLWPQRHGGMRILSRIVPAALVGLAAYFAAASLARGLVSPFILYALVLVLLPWARFAETRAHCLCYGGAAVAGIAAGLLAPGMRFNPMLLLAVAWILWLSAILGWMRVALNEKKAGRRAAAW